MEMMKTCARCGDMFQGGELDTFCMDCCCIIKKMGAKKGIEEMRRYKDYSNFVDRSGEAALNELCGNE